jgi:hypothetical protein
VKSGFVPSIHSSEEMPSYDPHYLTTPYVLKVCGIWMVGQTLGYKRVVEERIQNFVETLLLKRSIENI